MIFVVVVVQGKNCSNVEENQITAWNEIYVRERGNFNCNLNWVWIINDRYMGMYK